MDQILNLNFIIKLVRRYWRLLVGCMVIGLAMAAFITYKVIPPRYEADVQILVSRHSKDAAAQYTNQQADVQMITTYKELITSQVILAPVLEQLKAKKTDIVSLTQLRQAITIASTQNSQVFSIKVTNADATHSAEIANQIAEKFKTQVRRIMKVNNVTIISPAIPATQPQSPKRGLNLLVGLLLGLGVGTLIGTIRLLQAARKVAVTSATRTQTTGGDLETAR